MKSPFLYGFNRMSVNEPNTLNKIMPNLKTIVSKALLGIMVSLLFALLSTGCAHKTALELPESDQEQTTTE